MKGWPWNAKIDQDIMNFSVLNKLKLTFVVFFLNVFLCNEAVIKQQGNEKMHVRTFTE